MYGEASNYQKIANDEVLVIPMIETQEGIDNIDEILSVPGISGIYVGPSDMGFSLGLVPMLDREEPLILGIYEKLLASCKRHGKFAGIHNGTSAYAARMIGMGFRFVTIANDSGLMARMARAEAWRRRARRRATSRAECAYSAAAGVMVRGRLDLEECSRGRHCCRGC